MGKDARLDSFGPDVVARFGFLVDEFGFNGPDKSEEGYVGYSLPPWQLWVVLDERNKTVDSYLHFHDGERVLSAPVTRVVRKARLKGLGRVGNSGQTRVGVQRSLSEQAAALQRLIPILLSTGVALMEP